MGTWQIEAETLRFSSIAMTKMACLTGMDQEDAFLHALESMSAWKIIGEHLEFYDVQGTLTARFEARSMQ